MKYKTLWHAVAATATAAAITALSSLLPVIDAQAADSAAAVAAANVIGLNLIQGNSNTVIVKLLNGTVVTLAPGASPNFSIDAVTTVPTSATTTIGSVQFSYNQKVNFRTETKAPYAMCGNYGTKYTKCHVLGVGKHSVAAKTSHTGSAWYRVNFEIAVANPAAAPIPVPVVVPTKAPVAATAPTTVALFTPIRINCGGGSYTDTMGHVWSADTFFSGGSVHTTNAAIANTDDDVLYQSERYGDATYSIPVLPASSSSPALYDVTLHMSEVYFSSPGSRIFDIQVENEWMSDVDLIQLTGGVKNVALQRTVTVLVADGTLTIKMLDNVPKKDNPSIMGIEVMLASAATTPTTTSPLMAPVPSVTAPIVIAPSLTKTPATAPPPTKAPAVVPPPTIAPAVVPPPTKAPVAVPSPTKAPVIVPPPTKAPVVVTVPSPTKAPVTFPAPTKAPAIFPSPTVAPGTAPSTGEIPVFEPVLINCGGGQYIDAQRKLWQADDTYWSGGNGVITSTVEIAETIEDSLYQSYRWGASTYEIPVPKGLYEVVLHFAETYFTTAYNRVFDVHVEKTILAGIDIVDLGGGLANTAIQRIASAAVFDGGLTIQFKDEVNHALISAIAVNRIGEAPPTKPPMIPPPSPSPVAKPFETILINCGGTKFNDTEGRLWSSDKYWKGGATFASTVNDIVDTKDDPLYWTERFGLFSYEIPVPLGNYEVVLYFAEIYFQSPGVRIFDVNLENEEVRENIDIVRDAGQAFKPLKVSVIVPVMDGFLTLQFKPKDPEVNAPKISAIEVRRNSEHFSHAVIGGPYKSVDVDGDGFGFVQVDGSQSHTHGPTNVLTAYTWRLGMDVVGSGKLATLTIPVGEHELTLTIVDSSGSISSDSTKVVVKQKGFPELFTLSPSSGDVVGGTVVKLSGQDIGAATSVRFGRVVVPQQAITVIDSANITILSPGPAVGVPVKVSVVTPIGESNAQRYTFVASTPVKFNVTKLMHFVKPTAVAFGPDGKLYVATQEGTLSRITLNDAYDEVISSVTGTIDKGRCILGIAFDPLETPEMGTDIAVYISTSFIYHGQHLSTFGNAINGKVKKVSGPNLDNIVDIVTGLPVSEIDHSVNALYFGNNGELYIGVGSNTNAGFPGGIMGSGRQLENFFSAAVLVANLGQPTFNGQIRYDSNNNGNPISGFGPNGVEVFANGLRNPYGITMHTNGKLYATDNGPNKAYGPTALNCSLQSGQIEGVDESDKLVLLKRGAYYGHPNHKRAQSLSDPRQCTWRSNFAPSSADGYTAPLMRVQSSTCGIIEFESDHFGGQMRGDLILSKYNSELYRVILSADGESVNAFTDPAVVLDGNGGLAVTQAPDGSLIDVRHTDGECHLFKPIEAPSTVLDIKSVFPRRGALAGGSKFMIFGVNFGGLPIVTVGGSPCSNVVVNSPKKMTCTLPPGTVGRKDVKVTIGPASDTFVQGYRYITGLPA